ncbi:molecular chaperone [Ramlibacter sp.]|uniref:fimbrial biogenesis chaperone n=1 Tax=Ramlibacter sp. TaxID=1917967 RepID=UPI0035B1C2AC
MTAFRPRRLLARLAAACLATASFMAHAMSFTPIEMDFSPSGRGATQVFRLENTTAEPTAVEITLKSRQMKADGEDVLADADDQFNVFPAQVVLQPGQAQTVRVQYVGPAALQAERAFRLIAEQLPIDVGQAPTNGGRMRLLVKYVASVYVVPANVRAVLKTGEAKVVTAGNARWLEVPVTNEGGTRRILKNAQLEVAGRTLGAEQLKGLEGENVLAGTTRVFRVPAPADLPATPGAVRLIVQ